MMENKFFFLASLAPRAGGTCVYWNGLCIWVQERGRVNVIVHMKDYLRVYIQYVYTQVCVSMWEYIAVWAMSVSVAWLCVPYLINNM